jgi:hypothetical protein
MSHSYAARSGKSQDEIIAAYFTDGKDHWLTADEAVANGFADEVAEMLPIAASAAAISALDLSRYANAPRASAQRPAVEHAPVPQAAAAASTPAKETRMTAPVTTAASPDADAQAKIEGARAEAQRRNDVDAKFASVAAKVNDKEALAALQKSCTADINCTAALAGEKILALMAKDSEPVAGAYVATVHAEADKQRACAQSAILIRAGLAKDDTANPMRGESLIEMAKASLKRAGVNYEGKAKMDVVALSFTHGSSDFPLILENTANKAMLKGYEEAEETFQRWTSKGTLPDFKAARRSDIGTFPSLREVRPGAEYKSVSVGERGETVQLATYGEMFSINRQAIINDDMNAFTGIPRKMGRAAIRTVGDLVYALFTSNGPTMGDGVALFNAAHNNLLASGGAAPNTANIDAARVAMARQRDGTATLNLRPRYWLGPVGLGGAARLVANSEFEVGASTRNNTTPNIARGLFEVIDDARLDALSATAWYMVADPAAQDTIEVQYLDGIETPTLESMTGWLIDGVQMKVRMDAGVKALDWRTFYKNPGA